ncbi:MAG TPA: dehydrogenase [Microscillaceae bacterium]|nr:dehydrogenase [Microscillaceae bacterium]
MVDLDSLVLVLVTDVNLPMEKVDVLIIGGGPAGTSAALSLLNYTNLSVWIVEQSDLNRLRVGEHVSSSIFNLLDYLKIPKEDLEPESIMPTYGTTSYWGSPHPAHNHSIFTHEGATYQLDRAKFDLKLVEQVAQRGGEVFPRTKCLNFTQQENKEWHVTLQHAEKGVFEINAQYLVDATGRQIHVGRSLGLPLQKMDNLMGIGMFFQLTDQAQKSALQILEAAELGWWYAALLPDNKLVATFFTDADIIAAQKLTQPHKWQALLQNTQHIKHKLANAHLMAQKPWVRNAATHILDVAKQERFLAVGDAICAFDPISSMGIGFAITSAFQAARCIQAQLLNNVPQALSAYNQDILSIFDQYLKIRQQYYQQEKRWPDSVFWQRRQALETEEVAL